MYCTRSARPALVLFALASLASGCVIPKSVGEDPDPAGSSGSIDAEGPGTGADGTSGSTSGASGQQSTTVTATGATSETSGGTDPAGSDDTGLSFIHEVDGGLPGDPCDPWVQDCPDGDKCVPWANDGGDTWNFWRCTPVVDEPDAVGEPCLAESSGLSGIDSCDFGAMCWEVDPKTLEGTCVALCTGDEANPVCSDGDACFISRDGILSLCLDQCDPLLQDCAPDHACYPGATGFVCLPEGLFGLGAPGDPCEEVAACDLGSACVEPVNVPGCSSTYGCCTALCSIGDPMPPCLAGQLCTPWDWPGLAPAGYEDLGYCALP